MWRRFTPLVPAVIAGAAVAATSALGGSTGAPSQHQLREPAMTASATLRLPSLHRCVKGSSVRVGLVPPASVTFASLSVRVGDNEVLTLSGLAGPGSVRVALPMGSARVVASGTTSGGQFVRAAQTYQRCRATSKRPTAAKPAKPKPHATPRPPQSLQGGGVD